MAIDHPGSHTKSISCLLIIGIVLICNSNALLGGFVWDDAFVIAKDADIASRSGLAALFQERFLKSYYRPIVSVSFALERALWGFKPFGFHLTNLLLHALNSILVFLLFKGIPGRQEGALAAALLFAAHPAHKGVAYISDRTGMLCAFFFLGSVLLYFRFRTSEKGMRAWVLYAASFLSCALALFSKEEALMAPVVIVLVDVLLFDGDFRRRLLQRSLLYLPFFGMTLFYLWVRGAMTAELSSLSETFFIRPVSRLVTIPHVLLKYIMTVLYPINLDFNPREPLASSGHAMIPYVISFLVILSIAALIPWLFKRSRPTAFGLSWFFIVFVPMTNIVPILPDEAETALFTPIHFLYLPSVGLFLCAGQGVVALADNLRRRGKALSSVSGLSLCIVLIVCTFSVLSIKRNIIWSNEVLLFRSIVEDHPENVEMRLNLGNSYMNEGDLDSALGEYRSALRLKPESANVRNALGLAYLRMGLTQRSIEEFTLGVEYGPDRGDIYSNLAVAHAQAGNYAAATESAKTAVSLRPGDPLFRTTLGLVYLYSGQLDRAENTLREVLAIEPNYADAHNALGTVHALRKEYDKARMHWEEAVRIQPDFREARENLESLKYMK